jgi:hypothetical protein
MKIGSLNAEKKKWQFGVAIYRTPQWPDLLEPAPHRVFRFWLLKPSPLARNGEIMSRESYCGLHFMINLTMP